VRRSPTAWLLLEASYSLGMKALPPLADDLPWRVQAPGDDVVAQPPARQEDDLGSDHVAIW
jgi:hypothetical protein